MKLKKRYGIVSNREQLRRGKVISAYTTRELAKILQVDCSWFSRKITQGAIRIQQDPVYGCYLFPRTKKCVDQLKSLKKGALAHASF
jgi:hypothetical protein